MSERDLFSPPPHGDRKGGTFSPELDGARLNGQADAVWKIVRDGQWHTLAEIASRTGAPEASVSARLRDFRRPEFGGWTIERRRVNEDERTGQHEYRLLLKGAA